MKHINSAKIFLLLQKASQEGVDVDTKTLENSSDKFVMLLLNHPALLQNRATYHNILLNTRVKLAGLTKVSGKKCVYLSAQHSRTD